jgi:hypothetical protein
MADQQRMYDLIDSIVANAEALRAEVDTLGPPPEPPDGAVLTVRIGESVQGAYDTLAATGGTIKLEVGGVERPHVGTLRIAERPVGAPLVVITSDTEHLPPAGTRITREALPGLAVLKSATPNTNTITGDVRSRNVAFAGVAFGAPITNNNGIAYIGGDDHDMPTPADCPENYSFDRCVFLGDPTLGTHQGITPGMRNSRITDSSMYDIFEVGRDSQCIGGRNGTNVLLVENCYLEAGAENIMFGGADSASREMMSADIIIRRCHFAKQLAWMDLASEPSIKCLLEIKSAARVLVEACLFECNWARDWSSGVAIMLKAANQSGRETWATCEDVTIRDCVIRHVGSIFGLVGKNDSNEVSDWMRRVRIANVLAYDVNLAPYTGSGRGCDIANGVEGGLVVDHVTYHTNQHSWMSMRFDSGITQSPGPLTFTNSVVAESDYGYWSDDNGMGFGAAAADWGATTIAGNVFKQGERSSQQGTLPPDNLRLAAAAWDASFDPQYRILPGSPAAAVPTTDGTLPGADVPEVERAARRGCA